MQNSHILLADDDAALLTSLSDYFGRYGFDVDTAANLADMRRLSEEGHYDLLIAEPMMPGQHTAGLLREFAFERRIPVIIHSRASSDIDRILGLEMGAETPEEIALSIVAEIQAATAGHSGGYLRDKQDTIHDRGETRIRTGDKMMHGS